MKRRRHTPEQAVRKLREGERMLNDGQDLAEVLRQFGDHRVDLASVAPEPMAA